MKSRTFALLAKPNRRALLRSFALLRNFALLRDGTPRSIRIGTP